MGDSAKIFHRYLTNPGYWEPVGSKENGSKIIKKPVRTHRFRPMQLVRVHKKALSGFSKIGQDKPNLLVYLPSMCLSLRPGPSSLEPRLVTLLESMTLL